MGWIHYLLGLLRDPGPAIQAGYPVMALIIFAETGLMTFFLPGDSMLVVAGMYAANEAAQVHLSIWLLNLILIPAAVLGMVSSYAIGAKAGPALFARPRSRFFNPAHLQTAHAYAERYGAFAIFVARFSPIVRTFVPVVAGIARMNYRQYTFYNVLGAVAWIGSMTLGGYFLGKTVPGLAQNVDKVIVVVVLLSLLPLAWNVWKARRDRAKEQA